MPRKEPRPRLLITRPEPDGTAFAAMAARAGFESVLSPMLSISFRNGVPDLGGVCALVFTSANGVRAFAAAIDAAPELPIFAVGEITADAVRTAGFKKILTAGGDIESVTDLIFNWAEAREPGGDVLHIAGDITAGDLVARLTKAGVPARRAVLYEAVSAASLSEQAVALLRTARPGDAVVFFSARTAQIFLELTRAEGLTPALPGLTAACLSPAVAAAAGAVSWRATIIAPHRTAAALLGALSAAK